MRAKESAIEAIRDKDYNNLAFNDRIAYNMTYNASGVPLTSMMLYEMAKLLKPDWRILGIRTALWDTLREVTTTDLTGVQWASTVNEDHVKFRVNTDEVEAWGFQAAFVSLHYVENSLHQNAGGIPVGPAGDMDDGEVWMVTDSRVKVIVLDNKVDDNQLAWAIWTLAHMRYPLSWVLEAAQVETDGPNGAGTREWYSRPAHGQPGRHL